MNKLASVLVWPAIAVSILATSYTGFLFAQGLARDLWQGPHAALDLLAQAIAEGGALVMLASALTGGGSSDRALTVMLLAALIVHLTIISFENLLTPSATRHHALAVDAIRRGPFARLFWGGAVIGGGIVPLALLLTALLGGPSPIAVVGAILAIAGGFAWEYIWVEAGQSVPLS